MFKIDPTTTYNKPIETRTPIDKKVRYTYLFLRSIFALICSIIVQILLFPLILSATDKNLSFITLIAIFFVS